MVGMVVMVLVAEITGTGAVRVRGGEIGEIGTVRAPSRTVTDLMDVAGTHTTASPAVSVRAVLIRCLAGVIGGAIERTERTGRMAVMVLAVGPDRMEAVAGGIQAVTGGVRGAERAVRTVEEAAEVVVAVGVMEVRAVVASRTPVPIQDADANGINRGVGSVMEEAAIAEEVEPMEEVEARRAEM